MNYALGLAFILVAAVIAAFGDRPVQKKGGVLQRVFSWPQSSASRLKFPIAVAFAGVGLWFLVVGLA